MRIETPAEPIKLGSTKDDVAPADKPSDASVRASNSNIDGSGASV